MTIANYMSVHGQRVGITEETIRKTWLSYADSAQGCIDEALSGEVFINPDYFDEYLADNAAYKINCLNAAEKPDVPSGTSSAFWQKAYYIQSGECVGLLA